MSTERKYNETLAALWETKNGGAISMPVDPKMFDKLKSFLGSVEIGGKLILKRLANESREKFPNPERAPHYFLEYISKEEVDKFEANNPRSHSRKESPGI